MFTQEISDTSRASTAILIGGVVLVVIGLLLVLALFKWGRSILLPVVLIAPILLLVGATLVVAAGWTFNTLYISVDDRALEVAFRSPYDEQVPLQNIAQCQATNYDWRDYGGLAGVHTSQKGKLYNVQGDVGMATDLTVNDEPYKHLLFSSPDPKAVCDALKAQRPAIET